MDKKTESEIIERMAQEAKRGRLSRRDFMNYALAAGVTASTATGPGSTSTRPSSSSQR